MASDRVADLHALKDILFPFQTFFHDQSTDLNENDSGSREQLRNEVHRWIKIVHYPTGNEQKHETSCSEQVDPTLLHRVLWWNADAGSGKTYFSKLLSRELRKQRKLLATLFISRNTSQDPSLYIKSISYQIATVYPNLVQHIYDAAKKEKTVHHNTPHTITHLFDTLILDPLKSIAHDDCLNRANVLIMDGLDELFFDSNALQLLSCLLIKLPPWIKLFLTAKATPIVIKYLSTIPKYTIDKEHIAVQRDLQDFITTRITKSLGTYSAHEDLLDLALHSMMEHCEGSYAYVCVLEKLIEEMVCNEANKNENIAIAFSTLPMGLTEIYNLHFEYIESTYPECFSLCMEVIGIFAVSRIPCSVSMIEAMFPEHSSQPLISCLHQHFHVFFPLRHNVFYPFHTSILDWCLDCERNRKYSIQEKDAHVRWIVRSFAAVTQTPYSVLSLSLHTLNIQALARQFYDCYQEENSEIVKYLYCHMLGHFTAMDGSSIGQDLLGQFFLSFYWILGVVKEKGLLCFAKEVFWYIQQHEASSEEFAVYGQAMKNILLHYNHTNTASTPTTSSTSSTSKEHSIQRIYEHLAIRLLVFLQPVLRFQSFVAEIQDWLQRNGMDDPVLDTTILKDSEEIKLTHKHNIVYIVSLEADHIAVLTEKAHTKHHKTLKPTTKKMQICIWNYSFSDCLETIEYDHSYAESFLTPSYLFQVMGKHKNRLKFAHALPQELKKELLNKEILLNKQQETHYLIAGNTESVCLWDLSDGCSVTTLPYVCTAILDMVLTVHGRLCIGLHNKVVLWDVAQGKSLQELYLGDDFLTRELEYHPIHDEFYLAHTYCNVSRKRSTTERRIKVIGYSISGDLGKVQKHEVKDPAGYYFEDFDALPTALFFIQQEQQLLYYADPYSTQFTCYDSVRHRTLPAIACPAYQTMRLLYHENENENTLIAIADKRTVTVKAINTLQIHPQTPQQTPQKTPPRSSQPPIKLVACMSSDSPNMSLDSPMMSKQQLNLHHKTFRLAELVRALKCLKDHDVYQTLRKEWTTHDLRKFHVFEYLGHALVIYVHWMGAVLPAIHSSRVEGAALFRFFVWYSEALLDQKVLPSRFSVSVLSFVSTEILLFSERNPRDFLNSTRRKFPNWCTGNTGATTTSLPVSISGIVSVARLVVENGVERINTNKRSLECLECFSSTVCSDILGLFSAAIQSLHLHTAALSPNEWTAREDIIRQQKHSFTFQTTHSAERGWTAVFQEGLMSGAPSTEQTNEWLAERVAQGMLSSFIIPSLFREKDDREADIVGLSEDIVQTLLDTLRPLRHHPLILTTTHPDEDKNTLETPQETPITVSEEMSGGGEETPKEQVKTPENTVEVSSPSLKILVVEDGGYFDFRDVYPNEEKTVSMTSPVSSATTTTTTAYDDSTQSSNACCILQ